MGKVKAQMVGLHIGTGLMDMVAQNGLQRLLKQVGGGVSPHDGLAPLHVNGGQNLIFHLDGAADHLAVMQVLAALVLLDIGNLEPAMSKASSSFS